MDLSMVTKDLLMWGGWLVTILRQRGDGEPSAGGLRRREWTMMLSFVRSRTLTAICFSLKDSGIVMGAIDACCCVEECWIGSRIVAAKQ